MGIYFSEGIEYCLWRVNPDGTHTWLKTIISMDSLDARLQRSAFKVNIQNNQYGRARRYVGAIPDIPFTPQELQLCDQALQEHGQARFASDQNGCCAPAGNNIITGFSHSLDMFDTYSWGQESNTEDLDLEDFNQ